MSPLFQVFTWALSIVAALLATSLLKAPRWLGLILGAILAQGMMFVGVHVLNLWFGPSVSIGGTTTPVVANIITALIGALLGAALARLFRRNR